MHRTQKQNVDENAARIRISNTSKRLADMASEIEEIVEKEWITMEQEAYLKGTIRTLKNISLEMA